MKIDLIIFLVGFILGNISGITALTLICSIKYLKEEE